MIAMQGKKIEFYILTDVGGDNFWTGRAFRGIESLDSSCFVPSLSAIEKEQSRQLSRGCHLKILTMSEWKEAA